MSTNMDKRRGLIGNRDSMNCISDQSIDSVDVNAPPNSMTSMLTKGSNDYRAANFAKKVADKISVNTMIDDALQSLDAFVGPTVPVRIVDLCKEDKKRIVNLVEELTKQVEENKMLESTLTELKRNADDADTKIAKMNELHEKERAKLKSELCTVKDANKHLEKILNETKYLMESQSKSHERNFNRVTKEKEDLEKEKVVASSQVVSLKKKLGQLTKDTSKLEASLKEMKRDLSTAKRARDIVKIHRSVQTDETRVEKRTETSIDSNRSSSSSRGTITGIENVIFNELFFKAPRIPSEIENIFFPTIGSARNVCNDVVGDIFQTRK